MACVIPASRVCPREVSIRSNSASAAYSALTVRSADQHCGQVLELVLVKGQLILVPSVLQGASASVLVLVLVQGRGAAYLMCLNE